MTTAEITGLESAIAYAANLSAYCTHTGDQISALVPTGEEVATSCEQTRAALTAGGVTGQALTDVAGVQEQATGAIRELHTALAQLEACGAAASSMQTELEGHRSVQEAYNAAPGAGNKEFVTAAAPPGAGNPSSRTAGEPTPVNSDTASVEPAHVPVAAATTLADAFRRGHTVEGQFTGGQNSNLVQKVRLSDGTAAVYKQVDLDTSENPDEVTDAYLAGLVAHALGIEDAATAKLSDSEVLSVFVPGVTCTELRKRAGEQAVEALERAPGMDPVSWGVVQWKARQAADDQEWQRILHLDNSREIGLLDCLTGNLDRNDNNVLVDGDTVHPIDHSFAYFCSWRPDEPGVSLDSPFSQQHLHSKHQVHDNHDPISAPVPDAELISPFTTAELAAFRPRLEALRPAFEAQQAIGKWQFMMARLSMIEAVAT